MSPHSPNISTVPLINWEPKKFGSINFFLMEKKKPAWSSYNQIVCALRFFYAKTLKRPTGTKWSGSSARRQCNPPKNFGLFG